MIPDFGGELYSGLDDEGFLRVCRHARLLLHHKRAEKQTTPPMIYTVLFIASLLTS